MEIDDWFKPVVTILIVIFLIIFYLHSLNGRYVNIHPQYIMDSRTGILYDSTGEKVAPAKPYK